MRYKKLTQACFFALFFLLAAGKDPSCFNLLKDQRDVCKAFMCDISETYKDDAARLVFADQLDDFGYGARAEFIRTDIKRFHLEALSKRSKEEQAELEGLKIRLNALLEENRTSWFGEDLSPHLLKLITLDSFTRGFVEALDLGDGREFLRTPKLIEKISEHNFSFLGIRLDDPSFETLRGILALPEIGGITHLTINSLQEGVGAGALLAQAPPLKNLRKLKLHFAKLTDTDVRNLAQNTLWKELRHLDLTENNIGLAGARDLALNTSWGNLEHLDLARNEIGSDGARDLAQNSSWKNLQHLSLRNNNIGPAGARDLAQNTSWKNLQELDLGVNNIDPAGARDLAQNTLWKNLQYLDLSSNLIGPAGARDLAQNSSWKNLQHLAQNSSWKNLQHLALWRNNIGQDGRRLLEEWAKAKSGREYNADE